MYYYSQCENRFASEVPVVDHNCTICRCLCCRADQMWLGSTTEGFIKSVLKDTQENKSVLKDTQEKCFNIWMFTLAYSHDPGTKLSGCWQQLQTAGIASP